MSTKINYMGVWDEKSKKWLKASGTVKQGRRPMYQPNAQGHTPGPWEVRLSSGSDGRFISIIGQTWPLAHVYTNEIVGCEANARLIAAAPDLLAACKGALEFALSQKHPARLVVDSLRAAIAKAEGRAG